ncbi:MAG: DUF222 domain-containing protein, partial [Nitriliruptoraceae bacterium]
LDHEGLTRQLQSVEGAIRRLHARRCRLAARATARQGEQAERQAAEEGRDGHRAGQRARRQAENQLAGQLQWSPGEAKRATRIGAQLGDQPQAQAAFDAGRLPPRHAQLLAETLAQLSGDDRETAAARLVALAASQDATTFGRSCRRVLAQLDAAAAQHSEERRYTRRRAKLAATEDGMLALSGQWSGLDAETLATAVDAFRHPDVGGGAQRSAEQRTADAVIELARAALRAGEAPTVHGIRPHISLTLDYQQLLADDIQPHTDNPASPNHAEETNGGDAAGAGGEAAGAPVPGVVEAPWMGPLPYTEVRRLLADANVSRLLVDPDGVPVEAGEQVRTVPAGLWRALQARDGGCIAAGCDIPAGWCDVMHLATPYRLEGQLTIDTAGLGCRHHHRLLDLHGWQTTWHDRRPTLHPPDPSDPADGDHPPGGVDPAGGDDPADGSDPPGAPADGGDPTDGNGPPVEGADGGDPPDGDPHGQGDPPGRDPSEVISRPPPG